jgi:hypothetical protein
VAVLCASDGKRPGTLGERPGRKEWSRWWWSPTAFTIAHYGLPMVNGEAVRDRYCASPLGGNVRAFGNAIRVGDGNTALSLLCRDSLRSWSSASLSHSSAMSSQ